TIQGRGLPSFGGSRRRLEARSSRRRGPNRRRGPRSRKKAATRERPSREWYGPRVSREVPMPRFTQKKRPLWIDTPLGEDVLLLREVEGREELSSLFSFQLDLIAESDSISPKDIVGKAVTFSILRLDEEPRPFHGFVRRFVVAGKSDRLSRYRAEVVPWLWFLTRTSDCRIFQEMNALEIVEKIFQEHGFIDFEVKVKGSLPKWEYCVQYRESDFNFVSRILEECGIFYF